MLALNLVSNFVDDQLHPSFRRGNVRRGNRRSVQRDALPLFGSVFDSSPRRWCFFVHALNIALGIMGVAVHAVRLNTLEFSNGLDLQWSGFRSHPFQTQALINQGI